MAATALESSLLSRAESSSLGTSPNLGRQLEQPAPRLALLDLESPVAAPFPVASPPPVRASYPITPARRALLNTIRYAEGTWAGGQDIGYRILFGGSLMRSMERHPNLVMRTARYASAAAGAYQFMPFTWSLASRLLGLQKFSPEEQDQAALLLIQRRGALSMADEGRFTPGLAARLAPEWASFPTLGGSSYYGQPVRRFSELKRFYEDNLAQLLGEPSRDNANGSLAGATPCDQGQLVCRSVDSTGPSF
jgi:lysozyme